MTIIQKLKTLEKSRNRVCPNLSSLCLYSLVDNLVKFKRNNLPHSLYNTLEYLLNVISRCRFCYKWTLPMFSVQCFHKSWLKINQRFQYYPIPWQSFECSYKCCSYINMIHKIYKSFICQSEQFG